MTEFEKHEAEAFAAFRKDGDVLGLLSLADRCDEEDRGRYAELLRLVANPTGVYADISRNQWDACRFFLGHMGISQDSQGREFVFREVARLAWAEGAALRRELTRDWRFVWGPDNDSADAHGFQNWECRLQYWCYHVPASAGSHWSGIDSLSGIDARSVPAGPLADIVWGAPYGPDPYCRVVMAELAANNLETPPELRRHPMPPEAKAAAVAEIAAKYLPHAAKKNPNTRGAYQKARKRKPR